MHEEARGLDIELFRDVLIDLDQIGPALTAGAGLGFVPMLDARQVVGQGLAPGPFARLARDEPLGLGFDGAQIGIPGFFEQVPLLGREVRSYGQSAGACDGRVRG